MSLPVYSHFFALLSHAVLSPICSTVLRKGQKLGSLYRKVTSKPWLCTGTLYLWFGGPAVLLPTAATQFYSPLTVPMVFGLPPNLTNARYVQFCFLK